MSVGRDKGKRKMTLLEIEAKKERENQERRWFRLQEAKEKIFPETWKRKVPEESESEEEPEHGRVPVMPVAPGSWRASGAGPGGLRLATGVEGFASLVGLTGLVTERQA
jgi:hypothetical protein